MKRPLPALTEADRRLVADRMISLACENRSNLLKTELEAERFVTCGSVFRVYQCEKCRHQYRLKSSCNSRICEKCGRRFFFKIKSSFAEAIGPFWSRRTSSYGPKFLTLTWAADSFKSDYPDPTEFKRCQAQASKFMRWFYGKYQAKISGRSGRVYSTRKWRGSGGVLVFEVGAHGNLHAHALVYGPFIPQKKLSAAWLSITGSSFVIDIREAKTPRTALAYIMKYITKPPQSDSYIDIARWAWLIKGSRRIATYGVLFGRVGARKFEHSPGLVCLYDGEKLKFRGIGRDPGLVLIPYSDFVKYVDPGEGRWLRTWLNHSPDQDYKLN